MKHDGGIDEGSVTDRTVISQAVFPSFLILENIQGIFRQTLHRQFRDNVMFARDIE